VSSVGHKLTPSDMQFLLTRCAN